MTETTIALRGYERMASMAPHVSRKIVHVMLLRGPSITSRLADAVVFVFNRHPRMRALQKRDAFATATIHPPVTLRDVQDMRLLRVSEVKSGERDWQAFVDQECEDPFDRFTQLPFFLTVWVDEAASETRLMLFSDHYMSDGMSGILVLNDIVERVAHPLEVETPLPLRPSLYSLWLDAQPLKRIASEWLVWLLGQRLYKSDVEQFKPLLPPRSDQERFDVPLHANRTYAMFADGSKENAKLALAKCKEQGATFTGALAAAVALAHYHTAKIHEQDAAKDETCFKLSLGIDCNMRQRLPQPLPEAPVGYYVASKGLDRPAKEGVDLVSARFWDVARTASSDIKAMLESTFSLSTSTVFQDLFLHSELKPNGLGFAVPYSVVRDTCISNIGRYPFARTFVIDGEMLSIETLHFYNSMPSLAASTGVYVGATDRFGYSLAHKVENDVAQTLFPAVVALCEFIGHVESEETMLGVLDKAVTTTLKP